MYKDLIGMGWTLPEIDGMDIMFFYELIGTEAEEENKVVQYADEFPWL